MVIRRSTEALKRLFDRIRYPSDPADGFRMLNFDQVLPEVFVGTCPTGTADARRLGGGLGVTAVLNLQTDEDFERWKIDWVALVASYEEYGIVVERVPIRDFDADDLIERVGDAADRLSRLLAVGHRVYVHCTAGQQRSPATVIAYLVRDRGLSLQQSIEEIQRCRPCAPNLEALEEVFGQSANGSGT